MSERNTRIEKIINSMTLEDKITFCTGADFWHTKKMESYGIPALMMSDGPHGLRCQKGITDMMGINRSLPATCFPAAVTSGASWNRELYAEEGRAIGEEAAVYGVDVVLGPGCNIKRNPLCGRNFEYLSEDPYEAGEMAASFINGMQSTGIAASLKHFAANSQEYKRQNGDSRVDERALREIYLSAFETAVKESRPGTVMCSYNLLNGIHASDNKWLLSDVLRREWDFEGMVVSDWGALYDRIEGFKAGMDLNMPGGSKFMEKATAEAVRQGVLSESDIDVSVARILNLVFDAEEKRMARTASEGAAKETEPEDLPESMKENHHTLALHLAEQGAVLLKNEDQILPAKEQDMVLIGYMAQEFRYQGAGSSHINPTMRVSLTEALPEVPCCCCGDKDGNITEKELAAAVQAARESQIAVVVAGLPESYESEGFDRPDMRMPEGHIRMIEAVAKANPHTVVVLLGGSPMEIPWADKVQAILYMGLSGQAGGQACANLLTGKADPSGKLTETWPLSYEDVVSAETFAVKHPEYMESIYVGYRYYDKAGKEVRFPFGHGLSYTSFAYSDLLIEGRTVSAIITNTGKRAGTEVVQLYVAAPGNGIHRPEKELKGFARVELLPGEKKKVTFTLAERSFALWTDGWKIPAGEYAILLGSSSRAICLRGSYRIEAGQEDVAESDRIRGEQVSAPDWQNGSWYETLQGFPKREEWELQMGHTVPVIREPKKGSYTMDSTCQEMKDDSLVMKIMYKVEEHIVAKGFDGKKDLSDPAYKMMLTCAADCPLRATIISAGDMMNDALAEGLLEMANGHYLRGLVRMMKK